MKYLFIILYSITAIGLYGCSQESEQSTTVSEINEETEKVVEKTKDQQNTDTLHQEPKEQFSSDIGKLYGFDIRSVVSDLVQDSFNDGFTDGTDLVAPKYPGQELGELLQKLETVRRDAQSQGTEAPSYQAGDDKEKLSYALGYVQGSQIQQIADDLIKDTFLANFTSAYNDGIENAEEIEVRVKTHIEQLQQKQSTKREQLGQENLQKSNDFLQKNKEEEGVVTTASGLQYTVLTMGDGDKPNETDQVEVHYEGKLLNDTIFDSSYQRDQTATFPLNGVIPGWTEGLQHMPTGSKFRFFIHPDLAYGTQGSGNRIGPNELLIFDVELIAIK